MGKQPLYRSLNLAMLPTQQILDSLTAIEQITMIGYPNGLWDEVNNRPITRRGITATHPRLSLNGKHEFMIDVACFPGSSGSPVFLFDRGGYPGPDGGWVIGDRLSLLGILYAGPIMNTEGKIVPIPVPTSNSAVVISETMINLGFIIKSSRLSEFEPLIKARMLGQR